MYILKNGQYVDHIVDVTKLDDAARIYKIAALASTGYTTATTGLNKIAVSEDAAGKQISRGTITLTNDKTASHCITWDDALSKNGLAGRTFKMTMAGDSNG